MIRFVIPSTKTIRNDYRGKGIGKKLFDKGLGKFFAICFLGYFGRVDEGVFPAFFKHDSFFI